MMEVFFWGWFGVCAAVVIVAAYLMSRIAVAAVLDARRERRRAREMASIRARMLFGRGGQS